MLVKVTYNMTYPLPTQYPDTSYNFDEELCRCLLQDSEIMESEG